jgi:ribosomal protein S18 acetylase RimI-like enzyme
MIEYQRHGAEALHLLDDVVALYAEVFAEPPYNESPEMARGFRRAFKRETRLYGFEFIAAFDGETLAGMAYGFTMPAGEWWRHADTDPPAGVLDGPKFAVMEWCVKPSHRGRGIGARLMSELLAARPEPFATLNVNPAAAARDIYLASGWEPCGMARNKKFPDMQVLVRAV